MSLMRKVVLNSLQSTNNITERWPITRVLTPAFFNQPVDYHLKIISLLTLTLQKQLINEL